jgi:protein arginine N-methyltransferase 2
MTQMDIDSNDPEAQQNDQEINGLVDLGEKLVEAILARAPRNEIMSLINENAPVWYQIEEGWSSLHAACFVEDSELVRELISRGSPWNASMYI